MRSAITTTLEAPVGGDDDARTLEDTLGTEDFLRERHAVNAVERVIERSSDAAQDLIECLLSGKFHCISNLPKHARAAIEELRATARAQHATADDFLLVYRNA
jgi:hypothetical protein